MRNYARKIVKEIKTHILYLNILENLVFYEIMCGPTAVARWLRYCATNQKVADSIRDCVIGNFHWYKILLIALWPWGRLSLYQKWVPEVFPGGKWGRCLRLTNLPQSCASVKRSGNLNFLETEVFPGGKCCRCVRLTTLPPSCAIVKKSGNLKFLEPGVFPGGKCCRCVRLTTIEPSCAVVKKSVNLNFMRPSAPL
jgi:hypothetical protein